MLQEGFAEGVPSKTIKLRIVDKTKNGYANETVLEDGVVYIQVGVNLSCLLPCILTLSTVI
ncbi:hypothetical protein BDZ97DRAFT_1884554 [Flammula alnicola]|nr:hypothetical protein BDZ97DRAFT_1884554 [Flammula alnicola]